MNTAPQVTQHPASVDAYIRHGWSLVPIPAGTKGPRTPGWNLKQNAIKSQSELPQGFGIGLAHAYSGTMALDIDEWVSASAALLPHGIDLNALYGAPDAVIVDSGRSGRGKLIYQMPFGLSLPSKKIIINGITSYELFGETVKKFQNNQYCGIIVDRWRSPASSSWRCPSVSSCTRERQLHPSPSSRCSRPSSSRRAA